MTKIWCMNLIDNRNEGKRNEDSELKFRLCKEKGILAIGWGVTQVVNSWQEYLKAADITWQSSNGYSAAVDALSEMKFGDLVWTKNPVSGEYYIAEIVDKSPEPAIYSNLIEFDICAYRRCRYLYVEPSLLTGPLCKKNLRARKAIEQVHVSNRKDTIDATLKMFTELKEG